MEVVEVFHVKTFVMDTEKGAALKPLEEAEDFVI